MKYLLVFGLVFVIFWLWRSRRQSEAGSRKQTPTHPKPASLEKVTEIVACQVCHVHLPRHEALVGKHGLYCSGVHKQQAGD